MAGLSVAFDDKKATVRSKQTQVIAFVCEKGSDGMFYLRGERQDSRQAIEKTFVGTNTKNEWRDVTVEIDELGETKNKKKLPKPK